MPNFSLVLVSKRSSFDGTRVDGQWLQGACACTLEEATERAKKYEEHRPHWDVAVVPEVPSPTPQGIWAGLKRLDTSRRFT